MGEQQSVRAVIKVKFRQARLDRDEPTKNVINMLKNKVLMELKSGSGVEESDEMWLRIIKSYAKQMGKAVVEFEKAGERGNELKAEAQFELDFCNQFLPKKLDEAATEALIRDLAARHGIDSPKQMGKLMGLIMKEHREQVDGGLVRKVATRVLSE